MAAILTAELLHFAPETTRTAELFRALTVAARASDVNLSKTQAYRGESDLLVLWGPGSPLRWPAMQSQQASGRHVLCFDLAYWNRDRKVRVSIDAAHPQAWIGRRDWPGARWDSDPAPIADQWKPAGPVLVAGIGRKAREQYGSAVDQWEAQMIQGCRARGLRVQYRPKREGLIPAGAELAPNLPIDRALAGLSAVVTWHSNVAVDAIRMGIPAICRDGAAAAICPSGWPNGSAPQPFERAVRDRFLRNLAWFQWAPSEARDFWPWVREVLA